MKKILFIAPSSYPLYGAESIVNLKLLTALSQSGKFEIDLISKKNKHSEYKGNSLEEMGITLKGLHIVEVDNTINLRTLWGHFMSFLCFGVVFKGSHWAYYALKVAKRLCRQNHYDYVLTKNSPSLLVGFYLKKHFRLKWAATWNDPYPDYLYPEVYATFMHGKKDWASLSQIRIINKYVDVHIFPNNRLRDYLIKEYKVATDKTQVIPHVVLNNDRIKKDSKHEILRIVHSGNVSFPRDPESFFIGLRQFLNNHEDASIQVDVIGVTDSKFKNKVSKYQLEDYVHNVGPLSYLDSLRSLSEYDVCLIIEANVQNGLFLPTKVSDFMQMHMPIMTISPQNGVLHDLFVEHNIGYFANVGDPNIIENTIEQLYSDFRKGQLTPSVVPKNYKEEEVVFSYLQI